MPTERVKSLIFKSRDSEFFLPFHFGHMSVFLLEKMLRECLVFIQEEKDRHTNTVSNSSKHHQLSISFC